MSYKKSLFTEQMTNPIQGTTIPRGPITQVQKPTVVDIYAKLNISRETSSMILDANLKLKTMQHLQPSPERTFWRHWRQTLRDPDTRAEYNQILEDQDKSRIDPKAPIDSLWVPMRSRPVMNTLNVRAEIGRSNAVRKVAKQVEGVQGSPRTPKRVQNLQDFGAVSAKEAPAKLESFMPGDDVVYMKGPLRPVPPITRRKTDRLPERIFGRSRR